MTRKLLQKLRGFASDVRGTASIEIAIFAPLLIFLLGAAYVYYDAFRQKAINTNAAFTISDALSRETDVINGEYLDGMHDLLDFLTRSDTQVGLRVTMVRWNKNQNKYKRDWSKTRGPLYPLKNRDLNSALVGSLPVLLHNERVIVVETSSMYEPPINIPGLDTQEMYNFAFTRPRFAPKLVWSNE